MSDKFHLDYGFDHMWLIRWRDNNCDKNWRCFFTLCPNDADQVIKQHCGHDGFEFHEVKVVAKTLGVNG